MPDHCRIEKADTPAKAYQMAFGRGNSNGAFEVKDLGTRVSVIQNDKQRMILLDSPDGWKTLGKTIEEQIAERRAKAEAASKE
jgi:hypothetical protein